MHDALPPVRHAEVCETERLHILFKRGALRARVGLLNEFLDGSEVFARNGAMDPLRSASESMYEHARQALEKRTRPNTSPRFTSALHSASATCAIGELGVLTGCCGQPSQECSPDGEQSDLRYA